MGKADTQLDNAHESLRLVDLICFVSTEQTHSHSGKKKMLLFNYCVYVIIGTHTLLFGYLIFLCFLCVCVFI